ncbi:hypothetical protein ACLOJK_007969 [Asimina triloba]
MRTRGGAGHNHNPGKKKGLRLHERLMQQERRLDRNPKQQEIEVAVEGQTTMKTQEGERAATQSRADDGGYTLGRRGHASEEGQDYVSGSRHRADRDQRAKGLRTRTNEVTRRNIVDATSAILDAITSN